MTYYWNYRVMRREVHGEVWYGIHEVYFNAAGEPVTWTENPVELSSETPEGLRAEARDFLRAAMEPVLDYHAELGSIDG